MSDESDFRAQEAQTMKDEIVERVLDDSPESPHTDESIRRQLRTVPAVIWVGLALWIALGIYETSTEGLVYGVLFIVAGLLGAYVELRSEKKSAAKGGLASLLWPHVVFFVVLGAIVAYGLYVAQSGSAFLLLLFLVHEILDTIPQLFGANE